MRIKNLLYPFLLLLVIVSTSCLTTTDPLAQYTDWKVRNETYFTNMKDSAGFSVYSIPVDRGGGSFYTKTLVAGSGVSPLYNDTVIVQYQGRLIDWTMFDKTYAGATPDWNKNEDPRSFSVSAVIKGWTEALMQMKVGEKRRIVLPWQLGYGSTGSGAISPYSTLIFDIQLISFGTPKNK